MEETKVCKVCGKEYPLSMFDSHKLTKDGKSPKCKHCTKEYNQRYQKANKECAVESQKRWVENNREKYNAYQRSYRQSNPQKWLDYYKEYRAKQKDK